jgi:uncharacterized protein YjiS (DUF1127 family)
MASVLIVERQASGLRREQNNGRPGEISGRIRAGLRSLRAAVMRYRREAEIRRKLADVDDHLLRDIGLVRTNGRIESIEIQRCLGYRHDF